MIAETLEHRWADDQDTGELSRRHRFIGDEEMRCANGEQRHHSIQNAAEAAGNILLAPGDGREWNDDEEQAGDEQRPKIVDSRGKAFAKTVHDEPSERA